MKVILLPSPLQPQSDIKVIPEKKSYVDDWWFFIDRLNVGNVSRMRNKKNKLYGPFLWMGFNRSVSPFHT